jgi:hypothetical protein
MWTPHVHPDRLRYLATALVQRWANFRENFVVKAAKRTVIQLDIIVSKGLGLVCDGNSGQRGSFKTPVTSAIRVNNPEGAN